MNDKAPRIYLIPSIIAAETQELVISPQTIKVISFVDHYLVENVRTTRRFISSLKVRDVSELHFEIFNQHSEEREVEELVSPLKLGKSIGLISEAGCPAIADPGNLVVQWAHRNDVKVTPLSGPSSIFLALMASGLNGQNFEFHGYLPIDKSLKIKKIKSLESESKKSGKTQIFMETPYRNEALIAALLNCCRTDTKICLASNLTADNEMVSTKTVAEWKREFPKLQKVPAIFLMQAGSLTFRGL